MLAEPEVLVLPGVYDALSAALVQRSGFRGAYMTGAGVSMSLIGFPDLGFTTMTEMAGQAARITGVLDIPLVADADTGFGNALSVQRTVAEYQRAGVAGLHIEDQVNPKRCGHLDGKQVVDEDTALKRIRSAADARRDSNLLIMARTDIRAVEGLASAIDRAKALVDAGADAIFPEAMTGLPEFDAVRSAVDVPILANMTEFGKSDLFTVDQLRDVGVNIVIWPVSLLRLAMGAAERGLDQLLAQGTLEPMLGDMQHRADLYDLIDYEGYNAFDTSVYNFEVRR